MLRVHLQLFTSRCLPARHNYRLWQSPSLNFQMSAQPSAGSDQVGIDDEDWQKLGVYLKKYDEQREAIIKRCRDVQKLAKQAIFSLHRNDIQNAVKQLETSELMAKELLPIIQELPSLRVGSFSNAMEEFAEAVAFKVYLTEHRLVKAAELPLCEPEEYLGGVLDFTGELNRFAVQRATLRDKQAVQKCQILVEEVMGRFLQFDLRNSNLRKKYDTLKYTLKKLENTLYELSLTENLGLRRAADEDLEEHDTQRVADREQ